MRLTKIALKADIEGRANSNMNSEIAHLLAAVREQCSQLLLQLTLAVQEQ